nr:MAG TPA: hypothetical protein [Caudoviricetes sp.]
MRIDYIITHKRGRALPQIALLRTLLASSVKTAYSVKQLHLPINRLLSIVVEP